MTFTAIDFETATGHPESACAIGIVTVENGIIVEDDEKLKKQLIVAEQNKLLNKFSTTHLEKSKKKYLIKFL